MPGAVTVSTAVMIRENAPSLREVICMTYAMMGVR
jgi:hypothetical protein